MRLSSGSARSMPTSSSSASAERTGTGAQAPTEMRARRHLAVVGCQADAGAGLGEVDARARRPLEDGARWALRERHANLVRSSSSRTVVLLLPTKNSLIGMVRSPSVERSTAAAVEHRQDDSHVGAR